MGGEGNEEMRHGKRKVRKYYGHKEKCFSWKEVIFIQQREK